jgi:hypothetical protein
MPPLKNDLEFLSQLQNETCESKWLCICSSALPANGLRYLRWGGDGEAVQPEK